MEALSEVVKRRIAWVGIIGLLVLLLLPSCQGLEWYDTAGDTDGDGWSDAQEKTAGTDPGKVDTDDDGYWDPHDPNPLDPTITGTAEAPQSTAPDTPPVSLEPGSSETPTPSVDAATTDVTNPEQEALRELQRVQDAVLDMMRNNDLSRIPNPVRVPTSDMHHFPDVTTKHGKAGVGYVLFLHDFDGDGSPNTNYIRGKTTKGKYICDDHGNVTQVSTGYE